MALYSVRFILQLAATLFVVYVYANKRVARDTLNIICYWKICEIPIHTRTRASARVQIRFAVQQIQQDKQNLDICLIYDFIYLRKRLNEITLSVIKRIKKFITCSARQRD